MILLKSKCLVVSNGDLAFRLAAFIRNLCLSSQILPLLRGVCFVPVVIKDRAGFLLELSLFALQVIFLAGC